MPSHEAGAQPWVFFGTPTWAVPSLKAAISRLGPPAFVVTNPDRPAGRGYGLKSSPIKEASLAAGLRVIQPERVRDAGFIDRLSQTSPQIAVVVAYGKILPLEVLDVPSKGFVNLHFSLLPEFRGAAPVQRAIMEGKATTGVSIMVLTEGMDEGPVLAQRATDIGPHETAGDLGARLAEMGAGLLAETLLPYLAGDLSPQEQDDSLATYAPKISPEEAAVDWSRSAESIADHVRGLNPVPGAWTMLGDKRVKIHRAAVVARDLSPGTLAFDGETLAVGTGLGALAIVEGQLQGKQKMSGGDLGRGIQSIESARFTSGAT